MHPRLRALFVVSAVLSLAACDKSTPPAAAETVPVPVVSPVTSETDNQLAEARDALQRQALEIETKSALMDKQLADMEQALKDRENAELRGSLDTLKQQNEALRVQAEAARRQSDAITQRIAVTPPPLNAAPLPPAVVLQPDYSLFYDQLAPYGRWFDVSGYGYCWRPTITVAGWRPYVDGCWVWSSLGWAWQSNEVFGWATYHYGRWVNLSRYGWVWVPGSEWAPAWVAWRQSRDCVGWAPLPPEQGICNGVYRDCDSRYGLGPTSYTFINTNQFVSSSYISIYAPVTQQTTIFQHSVNVTQIVPRSGGSHEHGHAFVNQGGPPRGQMEQACGRPVPQRQVQTVHADQVPEQQSHHQRGGHREAAAPVAMVELPTVTPGTRMRHPEIKEHIQRPTLMSGFEGVPQRVATEILETIAKEKETAAVQQQHQPVHGRFSHGAPHHPGGAPGVANVPPVLNAPPQETVRPAVAVENPPVATAAAGTMPVAPAQTAPEVVVEQTRPGQTTENRGGHRRGPAAVPTAPSQPIVIPAVVENKAVEPAVVAAPVVEPERAAPGVVIAPPAVMPQVAVEQASADAAAGRNRGHAAEEPTQGAGMPHRQRGDLEERALAEKKAAELAAAAEVEKARQQTEATAQQQRMAADQTTAEAEKARQQAEATAQQQQRMAAEQTATETEKARQQAEATAQQQRMAAEQAAAAETEKARQQAEATAQQQRMAAEQAAAEAEKTRRQTEAAAMQQQQELAAQQQRAAAERMANEQAAAAEASRAQQAQAEAAAMQQRQQEEVARRAAAEEQQMRAQQEAAQQRAAQEMAQRLAAEEQARRVAEDQQMRAQQEAAQRAQEMAQRQAEEQARRQQEAEMQRAQEQARQEQMRAQQEAAQRAQEMAQRQAEEQARRQQEEMQRAQEQARQEQMRAQQEAAQRAAQEMAQRQAEEQARRAAEEQMRAQQEAARRAQEEAQRAAAEAAQRAAAGNGAGGR